jgi:ATP-dependent Clp protease adaptor protein ClpS
MKHIKTYEGYKTDTEVEIEEWEDVDIEDAFLKKLIVHNDDVNTFEHVIKTLMTVCQHTIEQAEQCAYLIHTKGKCVVKHGSFNDLKKYKDAILDAKIQATIED